MKPLGLGEVERQVMRQDAVPELGLRTRDDLVRLRQLLDVGGPEDQRVKNTVIMTVDRAAPLNDLTKKELA